MPWEEGAGFLYKCSLRNGAGYSHCKAEAQRVSGVVQNKKISSGAGKYLNPNLIIIQDIKLRKKNPLTNNLQMLEKKN